MKLHLTLPVSIHPYFLLVCQGKKNRHLVLVCVYTTAEPRAKVLSVK